MTSTRLRVAAALAAAVAWLAPDIRAQLLPAGFADEALVEDGLSAPVGLSFLPDGRIVVIELAGAVKVWSPGGVGRLGQVPGVAVGGELGLLGVAVDPAWPAAPHLYFYYAHEDPGGVRDLRVSRFAITGDVADGGSPGLSLGARRDVITGIPELTTLHAGGGLEFGRHGMLHVGVGDGASPCDAQDLASLRGSILRLDVSGLPAGPGGPPPRSALAPPAHPFAGPTTDSRLIHAHGLRNPFRFRVDRASGALVVGDVGEASWEEINLVKGGENFGWPWLEGSAPFMTCPGSMPASLAAPVLEGTHSGPAGLNAVIPLGGIYRNPPGGALAFGPLYEGSLFFSDYIPYAPIFRAAPTPSGFALAAPVPGQPAPQIWGFARSPVDARVGPDGALYYVSLVGEALRRIKPTGNAPVLTAVAGSSQAGNAGWPAPVPLAVRLVDPAGAPMAGVEVRFGVTAGGGSVAPAVGTDANGVATAAFTLPAAWSGVDPVVTATWGPANPVRFEIGWRGLIVGYDPVADPSTLALDVRHSAASAPLTIAIQVPPPPSPFVTSPSGAMWTSVLAPAPGLAVVGDGLGLLGPPHPGFVTDAAARFGLTVGNVPILGGVDLVMQAYAVDFAASFAERVMISNPVVVTIP